METNQQQDLEGIGTSLNSARSLSILKDAEERRTARESTLFLDVPSWNGDLIAEYRVVPPDELAKVANRVMQRSRNGSSPPGENDVAMIIAACVGLYVKDPETGGRVPVEDEHGHVGYNRIAHVLGKEDEIDSVSKAVRYLMAERDDKTGEWVENIVAMSLHAQSIARWTRDPSKRDIDLEALLGEL